MREHRGSDETLEDTEGADSEFRSQHREELVEEFRRPSDLRKDHDDDLEDNEQAVENSPENTSRLIGHSATPIKKWCQRVSSMDMEGNALDVITVNHIAWDCRVVKVPGLLRGHKGVHGLYVFHHNKDAARKDEKQRDDAESTDNIESNEDVWGCDQNRNILDFNGFTHRHEEATWCQE